MTNDRKSRRSHLFLLRLWNDQLEGSVKHDKETQLDEDKGRHGRLLNVLSGEGRNFDSWEELVDLLRGMNSPASTAEKVKEGEGR